MQAINNDPPSFAALMESADEMSPADLFQLAGWIQARHGGIPRRLLAQLATRSGVPQARIWGALTAYPRIRILEGE